MMYYRLQCHSRRCSSPYSARIRDNRCETLCHKA